MAVILALLFRGFVAEAFVIPTGSMAPTLQGRHKDVWCPKCGANYQTTASSERTQTGAPTGSHVTTTTCPICRYTQRLDLFESRTTTRSAATGSSSASFATTWPTPSGGT
jgi:signal peptidase I